MKKFFSEPLFHFLLAGGVLLALTSVVNDRSEPRESDRTGRRIRVDAPALALFVRAKTRIEDEVEFAERYSGLGDDALRDWVERYVREEALVREARRLGLDQNDDLIRRRLVQQIEFVAIGAARSEREFGAAELNEIYLEKREDYRIPATTTFSHVFVRVNSMADEVPARTRSIRLLEELNAEGTGANAAFGRGDRFLYNQNYVERTMGEVESHFGDEMTAALIDLEPNSRKWQGPLRSTHGFHLVLMNRVEMSRLPEIEEIREVLHEDWRRAIREAALDGAVEKIISEYEVEVDAEVFNDKIQR